MSLQKNIEKLSNYFSNCKTSEDIYQKIIFLGSKLPQISKDNKAEKNLVKGCQSKTYLFITLKNNKVFIEADSDALISKGICAILFLVYQDISPIEILQHSPTFLKNLNIEQNLSPNRSNGLFQILNKIKKDTLKLYLQKYSK
jgi:sulfur transfer protein SufE